MVESKYKSFDDLPLFLTARMVSDILGLCLRCFYCFLFLRPQPLTGYRIAALAGSASGLFAGTIINRSANDAACVQDQPAVSAMEHFGVVGVDEVVLGTVDNILVALSVGLFNLLCKAIRTNGILLLPRAALRSL